MNNYLFSFSYQRDNQLYIDFMVIAAAQVDEIEIYNMQRRAAYMIFGEAKLGALIKPIAISKLDGATNAE